MLKVGGIKMILDEVLNEAYSQFDSEDMTDSFVEGFLYAMELQERGSKLRDMNELAETLNEISANYITGKVKNAMDKAKWHEKSAHNASRGFDGAKTKTDQDKFSEKSYMHRVAAKKLRHQSARIMDKLTKRTLG
jgi:hypothetical protein